MKAVITVVGKDMVGILAKVATACANANANVIEVTQTVRQELFAMIMMVDIEKLSVGFDDFAASCEAIGTELGLTVHVMHEDIFNSMHRI